jgi:hypothetical protein
MCVLVFINEYDAKWEERQVSTGCDSVKKRLRLVIYYCSATTHFAAYLGYS